VEKIDEFALKILRQNLQAQEATINRKRPSEIQFKVGDWVFMQRPTVYVGPKMQTSWRGPYQITARTGEHSFVLHIAPHDDHEVHMDQIKKCWSRPDWEKAYPTVYRRGEPIVSIPEANIKKVVEVKRTAEGLDFLVEWTEGSGGGQNWLNARQLAPAWHEALALAVSAAPA
jgi:hypothetical protein